MTDRPEILAGTTGESVGTSYLLFVDFSLCLRVLWTYAWSCKGWNMERLGLEQVWRCIQRTEPEREKKKEDCVLTLKHTVRALESSLT